MKDTQLFVSIGIATALFVSSLLAIVFLVPRDASKTLSQHAASSRRTYWLLALALMGSGIPTYLFIWKWFMPSVGLGDWFIWVLAIGFVCQAVTAFVPDSTGWKHKTHLVSGYGLAAVLVIFMAILFFASDISGIGRILTAQFVWYQLACFF